MSKQYGFMIDVTRCTGCKTCQLACKDYKDLPVDINYRRVYEYVGGQWTPQGEAGKETWGQDVFTYYLSIACNHCSNPVCVKVCPSGAMTKNDDGFVIVDEAKCIGCKSCAMACPYGAPQFNEQKKRMSKCDGCYTRVIHEGKKPVCVESCPLRALDFAPIEEVRAQHGKLAAVAPLPEERHTTPNLVIVPSRKSRPVGDKDGFLGNPLEV